MVRSRFGLGAAVCVQVAVLGAGVGAALVVGSDGRHASTAAAPARFGGPVPVLAAKQVSAAEGPGGPALSPAARSVPLSEESAEPGDPLPTSVGGQPTPDPPEPSDPLPVEPGLPFSSSFHQHLPLPSRPAPPPPSTPPPPPPPRPTPTPPPPPRPTPRPVPPPPRPTPPPPRPPAPKPAPPRAVVHVVPPPPPRPRKPEIPPAKAAPPPERPDPAPDWGLTTIVALMVPATIAAAAAAGGAVGGPSGPSGPATGGKP